VILGRRSRAPIFSANREFGDGISFSTIRKLKSGEYRLYSRKKNTKTGKRRNLGTFSSLAAAKKHERAVQFFNRG
jgi:hypothetical protein